MKSSFKRLATLVAMLAVSSTGARAQGNASVGVNGAVAPLSSTQIGTADSNGHLQAASATHPVPASSVPFLHHDEISTGTTYAAGNCIGGVVSFLPTPNIVNTIEIRSKTGIFVGQPIVLYVFTASPVNSSCTDGAAFTLSPLDSPILVAGLNGRSFNPSVPFAGSAEARDYLPNLGISFPSGTTLYYVLVYGGTNLSGLTAGTELEVAWNGIQ